MKELQYNVGIDIGSVTAKIVVLNSTNHEFVTSHVMPTGFDTKLTAEKLLNEVINNEDITEDKINFNSIVATGYSRKNVDFSKKQVTEISCQGKGINSLFPEARTIIDIGGQDSKVIKIDTNGQLIDFEMNDKCSAGTGRFLEVMAKALEIKIQDMYVLSRKAKKIATISSTCTVFAESEVISRIAQGTQRENIIAGIHESIATKVFSLAKRVGLTGEIVITGGVAYNKGVVSALQEKIGKEIFVPENPQITGALGAALISLQENAKNFIQI